MNVVMNLRSGSFQAQNNTPSSRVVIVNNSYKGSFLTLEIRFGYVWNVDLTILVPPKFPTVGTVETFEGVLISMNCWMPRGSSYSHDSARINGNNVILAVGMRNSHHVGNFVHDVTR